MSLPPDKIMLGPVAISVPETHRGKGLARQMIRAMGQLARRKGYRMVVAAVRPVGKVRHPWVSIDDYFSWKDSKGQIYDPWLRSHVAAGGRLVRPCHQSVVIDEPLGFWEVWSQTPFEHSGEYLLPGCLFPIHIDLESGRGRYVESSVWVVHNE